MAEQTSQQSSQETAAKDNEQKQRQSKKMVSSTVKDVVSKGRTMTGKKPDQIDLNPVKENNDLFKHVSDVYDKFQEEINRSDTYKREWGTDSLTNIYKKDTPGQDINKKFVKILGKGKEAVSRSEYERNEIDLVPRDQNADRKEDTGPFRHQSIVKRRLDVDEARSKSYKSPWDKIEKAKPGIGKRIDDAAAGLKQNAADYQAILDKEKKDKEKVNEWHYSVYGEKKLSKGGVVSQSRSFRADNDKAAIEYAHDLHRKSYPNDDPKEYNYKITAKEKDNSNLSKNESVNSAGSGGVRGFGNVSGNPDGSEIGSNYVNANIADADTKDNLLKAQVKAHADLHVVSDKKVTKEEVNIDETSKGLMNRFTAKLILKHPGVVGKHPVGKDVQRKKALDLAMDKLIPSSAIKKPKVVATEETINEDLRQWFKDKWVRMDTKGNIKGDCAREPGEGKPKCLPIAKARAMDKDDRAAAARRKRREDPVADRPGKGGAPINVRTEAVEMTPANQVTFGSYTTKHFDICPSAVKLYTGIENKTQMSHLAVENMMLHDLLFRLEKQVVAIGHSDKDDIEKAEHIADLIMTNAKRMRLEKEHSYIEDPHLKTIRDLNRTQSEAANPAQQAAIAIALIKAGKKKGKDPGPQKEEVEHLEEKNKPTNPALWSRAKSLARSKFDVYPSAYANGWAAKWYKSKGGGWKSVSEENINELSNELIGKVNKARTLTDKKSKTPTAAETLNKAVEKVRRRTEVGKIK